MSDVETASLLIQLGPFADTPAGRKWADEHPQAMEHAADLWWENLMKPVDPFYGMTYWLGDDRE